MSKAEILDLLPTLRPDERQEILDRLWSDRPLGYESISRHRA